MTSKADDGRERGDMNANENGSTDGNASGNAAANGRAGARPREATGAVEDLAVCSLDEAIERRHSVRSYADRRIEGPTLAALQAEIDACNREGGLRIQLALDEPSAFGSSMMARYGSFRNVRNYVALIGRKGDGLDERAGYYGERIVLAAQRLGLNTCWVALTFSKRRVRRLVGPDERLVCVLAVGYGETQGKPRKSKTAADVCAASGPAPAWFERGVRAALLAPTAMNQQKFRFELDGARVRATAPGGAYTAVDLGIAKYHFEVGAGTENFAWA